MNIYMNDPDETEGRKLYRAYADVVSVLPLCCFHVVWVLWKG
ncbi:MAG: hypothetical protein K940chlam7_00559 [Chlamydiae bacterium]|nr:hypothetical protein [Chlamydiota bacterium]